jgi:putative flippase GtrA
MLQFVKFCLVGLSGVIVDTTVLVSLVELLSLDPRFAAVFAFFAAVNWNYALNRNWTFVSDKIAKSTPSYFSFVAICLLGLGVRIGIMHILIEYAQLWYVLASLVGIILATIFNFLGSRYVSFSKVFFKGNDPRR